MCRKCEQMRKDREGCKNSCSYKVNKDRESHGDRSNKRPVNIAFGRIDVRSGGSKSRSRRDRRSASLDKNASSLNIESVEEIDYGRYKVTFKCGTFNCGPDLRAPVVLATPCESGALNQVLGTDNAGNDVIVSELFPTEKAVVLCNHVDHESIIVVTGRTFVEENSPSEPLFNGVPVVTNDVSFNLYVVQADYSEC